MDSNDDLTFVAPHRRDEVRRRIRHIKEFIAAPGRAAAERHAASLNLNYVQFYRLVKVWRAAGRPEALAGAGRSWSRSGPLSEEHRGLLDEIAALMLNATATGIARQAIQEARRRGLAPPSQVTAKKYITSILQKTTPATGLLKGIDIVIEHAAVDLPVTCGCAVPTMPVATLTIEVNGPDGARIIGVALSCGNPDASAVARSLMGALDRSVSHGIAPPDVLLDGQQPQAITGFAPRLLVDENLAGPWALLLNTIAAAGIERSGRGRDDNRSRHFLGRLLPRKPGGIWFHPIKAYRKPSDRPAKLRAKSVSMSCSEALRFLNERLAPSEPTITVLSRLSPEAITLLIERLQKIEAQP